MLKRLSTRYLALIISITWLVWYWSAVGYAQPLSQLMVSDLDWSLDGSQLAVGYARWQGQYLQSCGDGTDILLIDVSTSQFTNLPRSNSGCSPSTVDFDITGSQILVSSASTFETRDLATGQLVSGIQMATIFQSAFWSPDGTEVLVTRVSGVEITDPSLRNRRLLFRNPTDDSDITFIYSTWRPDGEQVASSMNDGRIYVWNAADGQILVTFDQHHAPVKRLAWNPISNVIASGDDEGVIWIWDAASGEPIRELNGHTGIIYDIAWHPDGQELASAGEDNTLRVWNVSSGALHIVDSSQLFSAVAYSPDGTELAYAGEYSVQGIVVEIVPAPNVEELTSTNTLTPTYCRGSNRTPTRHQCTNGFISSNRHCASSVDWIGIMTEWLVTAIDGYK